MIVGSVQPERAGAASAISETASELGGALGIAVLGSLGTAIYRSTMASASLPGIPTHTIAAARDTLGAAVAEAQQLTVMLPLSSSTWLAAPLRPRSSVRRLPA